MHFASPQCGCEAARQAAKTENLFRSRGFNDAHLFQLFERFGRIWSSRVRISGSSLWIKKYVFSLFGEFVLLFLLLLS